MVITSRLGKADIPTLPVTNYHREAMEAATRMTASDLHLLKKKHLRKPNKTLKSVDPETLPPHPISLTHTQLSYTFGSNNQTFTKEKGNNDHLKLFLLL